MDTIPELRFSTLKYLPQKTLVEIRNLLIEFHSNKRNKTKSPYMQIFASLRDRFYQIFGHIGLSKLFNGLNSRINKALVFFPLFSNI